MSLNNDEVQGLMSSKLNLLSPVADAGKTPSKPISGTMYTLAGVAITAVVATLTVFAFLQENGPDPLLYRVWVEDEEAVCNDGSTAVYYMKTYPLQTKWLIVLEGHEMCFSETSCNSRMDEFVIDFENGGTTLDDETFDVTGKGILSALEDENPYFHQYNRIWARYCSSDMWVGNVRAQTDNNPTDYHFLGSSILDAILSHLSAEQGMYDATEIVITGEATAGAQGTIANLDRISNSLAPELFPDAEISGLDDLGWFVDMDRYDVDTFFATCNTLKTCTAQEAINMGLDIWNPILPEACDRFTGDDAYKCFYFGYWLNSSTLQTPCYHYQNVYDWGAMEMMGVEELNNETLEYVEEWGAAIIEIMTAHDIPVFLPACSSHGIVLFNTTWTTLELDNYLPVDAFHDWLRNGRGDGIGTDDCFEFDCNPSCPLDSGAYFEKPPPPDPEDRE